MVEDLGLLANAPVLPQAWNEQPTESQERALYDADQAVEVRLQSARMASSDRRRRTALNAYAELKALAPGMVAFVPLRNTADLARSQYNERTLLRLSSYTRETRWVAASTVSEYTSAIKVTVEKVYRGPIMVKEGGKQLYDLHLQMRREDGPRGERRSSRAMRSQHIRARVQLAGCDLHTRTGKMRHALRHVAHQGLMRGGEPGTVDGQPFDPALHLVLSAASVEWVTAAAAKRPQPVVALKILSIKDVASKRKRMPTIIAKLDPTTPGYRAEFCPYLALHAWWQLRVNEAKAAGQSLDQSALFLKSEGAVVSTADMKQLAQDDAAALGFDASQFFANAYRVGGATDLLEAAQTSAQQQGPEVQVTVDSVTRVIKARGRWWTDIYDIYARWSLTEQAGVSVAMTAAGGVAVEDVLDWRQPGR